MHSKNTYSNQLEFWRSLGGLLRSLCVTTWFPYDFHMHWCTLWIPVGKCFGASSLARALALFWGVATAGQWRRLGKSCTRLRISSHIYLYIYIYTWSCRVRFLDSTFLANSLEVIHLKVWRATNFCSFCLADINHDTSHRLRALLETSHVGSVTGAGAKGHLKVSAAHSFLCPCHAVYRAWCINWPHYHYIIAQVLQLIGDEPRQTKLLQLAFACMVFGCFGVQKIKHLFTSSCHTQRGP